MRREWTPDEASAWVRIVRDLLAYGLGAFLFVWQCVFVVTPSPVIVGAALALFGLPVALRLDRAGKKNGE